MEQSKIKSILTAPITLLRWSTKEERALFPSVKKGDCFCTFGLASGQTFIGHIPEKRGMFTFKPGKNLLPKLTRIEWTKTKSIEDLGYVATWYTSARLSEEENACYKDILTPKPDNSTNHPHTKIAFKYYIYPPLLQRAILIQAAIEDYRKKERALIASQHSLDALLFSEKSPFSFQNRSRV